MPNAGQQEGSCSDVGCMPASSVKPPAAARRQRHGAQGARNEPYINHLAEVANCSRL